MKYVIFLGIIFISVLSSAQESINWSNIDTLNTVLKDSSDNEKHVFVDVYTDWCGWCKRMDQTTFKDPEIVELLDKYFVTIKFDAEQKDSIEFGGRYFKFVDNGRRGYNELASALLQGKMSYPTYVFLNEKTQMIQPLPGYRSAKDLKPILIFIGKGIYKNKSYKEFQEEYQDN
tara:strand:- start:5073 stop:5594 length:522 start_codon:yes stop_codon:yes gene_type:complete